MKILNKKRLIIEICIIAIVVIVILGIAFVNKKVKSEKSKCYSEDFTTLYRVIYLRNLLDDKLLHFHQDDFSERDYHDMYLGPIIKLIEKYPDKSYLYDCFFYGSFHPFIKEYMVKYRKRTQRIILLMIANLDPTSLTDVDMGSKMNDISSYLILDPSFGLEHLDEVRVFNLKQIKKRNKKRIKQEEESYRRFKALLEEKIKNSSK